MLYLESRNVERRIDMKKVSLMIGLFTVLLTFTVGSTFADDDFHETICHFTPGHGNSAETLTIGEPAVLNAHMHHGDTVGACLICPPGVDSCIRGDGKPGVPGPAVDTAGASSLRELRGK